LFSSCFLLVFFLFIQCDSTENVIESIEKPYVTSEKVSLDNVLSVLKNPVILNQTETFKANTQESMTQKGGEKPNVYFTKIVKGNEYTTYLLLLNSYSTKNPYFMYYVITQNATTEKVGYLKYIPDAPVNSIDINTFSGKIQMLDLKKKIRTESRLLNGQPQKLANTSTARITEDCTITIMYIAHYCTNGGNHKVGESCGPGVTNDAYNEYTSISTICTSSGYDNSAPVPNEFINGSGGGGGGGGANAISDLTIFFEGILSPKQKMWWDNYSNEVPKQEIITYLEQNPSEEGIGFSLDMIDQMRTNFGLILDVDASSKSPANIDRSSIPYNLTKPENQKFNELYDDLTTSPEFKKLFLDIFEDSKRFNVKFEIAEHVNEDNDPAKKEVHATTSQDPVTKNVVIKISKQILVADGTMSQTNIENAKTILHECIHAYLFVKQANPAVGVDFVKILNSMYPTPDEQHDFMYNHMIPTMQKILSEIRDSVTTQVGRSKAEERTMYTTLTPLTSTDWNWYEYYKYVSLKGLDETSCFKVDFPKYSDQWNLLGNYINYGHDDLQQ
jgi:hypothetical protein